MYPRLRLAAASLALALLGVCATAHAQPSADASCAADDRLVGAGAAPMTEAGHPRPDPLEAPRWRTDLPPDPVADLLLRDPDPRPPRHVPFATLLASAYLGELSGIAVGALLGLLGAALSGCTNDEGWLGGYTCFAGHGYAASLGALLAMPVGTATGLMLAADGMRLPGEHAGTIGGAAVGMLPGGLGPLSYLFSTELSLTFLLSFIAPIGLSPLLATLWYADDARARPGFAASPYVRTVTAGAELGMRGQF